MLPDRASHQTGRVGAPTPPPHHPQAFCVSGNPESSETRKRKTNKREGGRRRARSARETISIQRQTIQPPASAQPALLPRLFAFQSDILLFIVVEGEKKSLAPRRVS